MKLSILDRFADKPNGESQSPRALQARTEPMEISLTDKAASAFSWAISFVALFASAAFVLVTLFRKRDDNA